MSYEKKSNKNTRVAYYDDTRYVYDGVNTDIAVYNIPDLELLDDEMYKVLIFGSFTESANNKSVDLEINSTSLGSHLSANTTGATHLGWSLEASVHRQSSSATLVHNVASGPIRTPLCNLDATIGTGVLGDLVIKAKKNGSSVAGEIIVDGMIIIVYKK